MIKRTTIKDVEDRIDGLETLIKKQTEVLDNLLSNINSDKKETKEESSVGDVSLLNISYNDENGVVVELDWDDNFITHLKHNGYTGITEEDVIKQWLAFITKDIEKSLSKKNTTDSAFE